MSPLLEVKNLHTQLKTDDGLVKAVDDVSFAIAEKEIVYLGHVVEVATAAEICD